MIMKSIHRLTNPIVLLILSIILLGCMGKNGGKIHQVIPLYGGTVAIDGIEITFPPNSISGVSDFTVSILDREEALSIKPQDAELVSDMYRLELEDAEITDEVYLAFPLEDVSGYKQENFFVALNHNGRWIVIPSYVDLETGVIHAIASHFSVAGVFYDLTGRKPKIVSIRPDPCPYIYQGGASGNFAMERDILWEVLVEDPYQRVKKVEGQLRIYTRSGELLTEVALEVGKEWRWLELTGGRNTSSGILVSELKRNGVNDEGLTIYSINAALSKWDFGSYSGYNGVSKLEFKVALDTDGIREDSDTYTFELSGDEKNYFIPVSPKGGEVVGPVPVFEWNTTGDRLTLSKQRAELHICPKQDLSHSPFLGIIGGCKKLRFDEELVDSLVDEIPKLKERKWWWGIVVYGDPISGEDREVFRTCPSEFTVLDDAPSKGGLDSITGEVISGSESTPTPTRTPTLTKTPTPTPTITPTPVTIPIRSETEYCTALQIPGALISKEFSNELLCGNLVIVPDSGNYKAHVWYDANENLDPFGTGSYIIGSGCIQIDNLTTGEFGQARCEFMDVHEDGRAKVDVSIPSSSKGDTIRVTMWVFEVYSGYFSDSGEYIYRGLIGLSRNDKNADWPDSIDGRDMRKNGCFYEDYPPCTFDQDIYAPYRDQIVMQIPESPLTSLATEMATATPQIREPNKSIPMVLIPAGLFEMGTESGDWLEGPVHSVYLDEFYIDTYEVTNAQYAECVEDNVCGLPSDTLSRSRWSLHASHYGDPQYDNHPVVYVNWNDAATYCAWREARLPTEAEWEKAARGTDGRMYTWGNSSPNSNLLNFDENVGDTTPVGSYPDGISPYGVYDMAGNVSEWVADWYDPNYYSISPDNNPTGPSSSSAHAVRNGGWRSGLKGIINIRVTNRFGLYQGEGDRMDDIGFRCASDTGPGNQPDVSPDRSTPVTDRTNDLPESVVPTSTPEPANDSPSLRSPQEIASQFITGYFDAISSGNYKVAWDSLSPSFQQRNHNGEFANFEQGYLDMKVCNVDVSNIQVEGYNTELATVTAHLDFQMGLDCASNPYDFRFYFIYDTNNNRWLVDRAELR